MWLKWRAWNVDRMDEYFADVIYSFRADCRQKKGWIMFGRKIECHHCNLSQTNLLEWVQYEFEDFWIYGGTLSLRGNGFDKVWTG